MNYLFILIFYVYKSIKLKDRKKNSTEKKKN